MTCRLFQTVTHRDSFIVTVLVKRSEYYDTMMTYSFQCFINHTRMLKMVIGKEIELVQEVANIYTT